MSASRVLYLCSGRSFRKAFPARKLSEIVECWERAGHDVRHICGGDTYTGRGRTGTEYGDLETHTRWYRNGRGLAAVVTSVSEWRDVRHDGQLLKNLQILAMEWKPDIVWERSCRLHAAGLTIAREIGVPYVLEWKDHLVGRRPSLFHYKALRMEAEKTRNADYIVVESDMLRESLAAEGVEIDKIIVAHNGVKADEFTRDEKKRSRIRKGLGLDDNTVLVGYLGSYAFYHDTERLVMAADIIRKTGSSPDTKVLMIGAGKEYLDTRKRALDLKLLDDIVMMKPGVPQGEVPGILAALDIAVLPGSTEIICPIKVLEYMACELPTVVPDYSCNREVIRDGVTGALFKPKDESALAEKIALLASDRVMRERIGLRAREEAVGRFSWEATWGAALDTVLERSGCKSIGDTVGNVR